MSCNKCHKKKCTCKKSSCNTKCLGCLYELSTECITLEEELTCFDESLPKGTDLTEVFEALCTKITSIEESIDSIELSASNITVTALDCLDESEIGGLDLQNVLEGFCDLITTIQNDIDNLTISATQIILDENDCFQESDVEGLTLQNYLEENCNTITTLIDRVDALEDCCENTDSDWFTVGTTTAPTAITDNIFHTGKVSIGKSTAGTVLDVVGDLSVIHTNTQGNDLKAYLGDTTAITLPTVSDGYEYLFGILESDNIVSSVLFGERNYLYIGTSNANGTARAMFSEVATLPTLSLVATNNIATNAGVNIDQDDVEIQMDGVTVAKFDKSVTARDTRFLIYDVDNGTLERVSVGDADSGGTGFKLLRIPN